MPDRDTDVLQAGERRSGRIESLRAAAALAVLGGHALLAGGGYGHGFSRTLATAGSLGVFLFFALTGYLLFLPFARRSFGDGKQINLRRYALNRVLRVLPLYYVVLIVLLIVNEHGGTFSQWWRFATFSQSFFSDTVSTVDGPMWSLVVEVQFYALLPLLAAGIALVARRSRAIAAAVIAAAGLASALVWWSKVNNAPFEDLRWRYSLPATFLNFTPGMLLALARLELLERPHVRLPSSDWLLAGGVACWFLAVQVPRFQQPLAALAALLVIAAVVLPVRDGFLVRALDARVLVAIGIASYSLYLWHYPVVFSLGRHVDGGLLPVVLAAVAVCIPLALASYVIVERPFLGLRRRWGSTIAGSVADGPPDVNLGVPAGRPTPPPAEQRATG